MDPIVLVTCIESMFRDPMNTRTLWSNFKNYHNTRLNVWDTTFGSDDFGPNEDDGVIYSEQSMSVDFKRLALQKELSQTYWMFQLSTTNVLLVH